jgi:hypothetical protein
MKSSHEISNDNGVRVVNFATTKNLVVKERIRLCELKSYKPWFDEECLKLVD